MAIRTSLVMIATLGGCAIGGPPDRLGLNADASSSGRDAHHGQDSATSNPDSSSVTHPDGAMGCAFSGVVATWDFSGASGSQSSTVGSAMAPGLTVGSIHRASTLSAAAGATSINASNWSTGATLDATKYFTLSIKPPAGCMLQLTSLSIDALSSSTGPHAAAIGTSADAFAQTTTVSTTAPSTPAVSGTSTGGTLEIRIYGFGATASIGTMRVANTLSLTGTLQ